MLAFGALIAHTGVMAALLTNTARVLLGMIAEGHGTGYAIKAEIERSTRFYWGASIGGIYPELRRLQQAGLVSRSDDPRGESRRHAYLLTPDGREALRAWLVHPEEDVVEMRNEGLLKLRFAGVLEAPERWEVVRRMRAYHAERVQTLEVRLAGDGFDDPYHRLTAEYALGWNTWARDWCDSTLAALSLDRNRRRPRRGTIIRAAAPGV
ncbi:MAG: PadR family transcriptional regulator [Solirubrobacteraceae bacterium]